MIIFILVCVVLAAVLFFISRGSSAGKEDKCPVCGGVRKYKKVISSDDQIYRHVIESRFVCAECDAGKYNDPPSISLD